MKTTSNAARRDASTATNVTFIPFQALDGECLLCPDRCWLERRHGNDGGESQERFPHTASVSRSETLCVGGILGRAPLRNKQIHDRVRIPTRVETSRSAGAS